MSNEKTRQAFEEARDHLHVGFLDQRADGTGLTAAQVDAVTERVAAEVAAARRRLGLSASEAAAQVGVNAKQFRVFEQRGNAKPRHLKKYVRWLKDNLPDKPESETSDDSVD
jgi:DNA-binding transcriptional regulator YiaG